MFLGTNDAYTAGFIGKRINKMESTILQLSKDKALLIESGIPYRIVEKYGSVRKPTFTYAKTEEKTDRDGTRGLVL